jgi:hypothetical protein
MSKPARITSGSTTAKKATTKAIITPLSLRFLTAQAAPIILIFAYAGNDADLRRGSWPWAAWLELYLPDLLLTVYRVARLNASPLYLHQLHNPENFLDEVSEFHHSNFCDVRVLRVEEDDAVSSAGTPAQTKRRRTGK